MFYFHFCKVQHLMASLREAWISIQKWMQPCMIDVKIYPTMTLFSDAPEETAFWKQCFVPNGRQIQCFD